MKKTTAFRKIFLFALVLMASAGCNTLAGPPDSSFMDSEAQAQHTPQYDIFFEGQPNLELLNTEGGYYLWRTGNTWHVRVAKTGRFQLESAFNPVYSGTVTVERGRIFDIRNQNVDIRNEVRQRQNTVVYRFNLRYNVEGFDFTVQPVAPQYCITFDLRLDNTSNPSIVHLGRTLFVPDRIPLTSCVP